jgi:cobalt-precorrin 5A hydrolase
MIIAGFGFRASVTLPSLRGLLGATQVDALAVVADKADHPALLALSQEIHKPLLRVPLDTLASDRARTPAPHQPQRYGKASVAEAAALAAAGPGSILIQSRITAPDGTATMALAQRTNS